MTASEAACSVAQSATRWVPPVEFWSLSEIRARLGADGVTAYVNGEAAVTDDTQMTSLRPKG